MIVREHRQSTQLIKLHTYFDPKNVIDNLFLIHTKLE